MSRKQKYVGRIVGADPLVSGELRLGVSNLGELSGTRRWGGAIGQEVPETTIDIAGDDHWDDVVLLMDGSSQTTDASNTATLSNSGATITSSTPYSTSQSVINLDGSNDVITVSGINLSGGDWTIECQVKFDALTQFTGPMSSNTQLIGGAGNHTGEWDFHVRQTTAPYYLSLLSINTVEGNSTFANDRVALNTTDWFHCSLSYVAAENKIYFGVNGLVVTRIRSEFAILALGSNNELQFGRNRNNLNFFNGQIADVRFTKGVARYTSDFTPPSDPLPKHASLKVSALSDKGVLSVPEALQLKSVVATTGPSYVPGGLVMHLDAAQYTSGAAVDLEGSGRSMTLYNGASKQAATGGRFNFDGTNDYMKTSESGLSTGKVPFTLEMWLRFDQYQSTRWWLAVMGQYSNANFHLIGVNQSRQYGVWGSGQVGGTISTAAGAWQQIAVTFDGANTLRVYENASLIGTNTNAGALNFGSDDLTIGRANGSENYFDGKMTILRLYNRTLPSAQIQYNFDQNAARHFLN